MLTYKQPRTLKRGGREMTGIEIYRNTAGNVCPSEIGRDMNLHSNGEFFSPKRSCCRRNTRKRNGLLAINPDAGLKIPMYLKRIPVASLRLPFYTKPNLQRG